MNDVLTSTLETTEQDLKRLAEIVESEPLVLLFLDHPLITLAEKERVFEGAIESDLTRRLLRVLIALRKSRRMRDVYDTFADIVRRELAMAEVEVRVPRPLSPDKQALLQRAIEAWVGRRVHLTMVVDESVIGGVRVQVSGQVVDNTLKSQLESIEENLLAV
jgi:F-type H+-transporting ATPase subunit delta